MDQFINFFETLPNEYKFGWIIICLMIAWIMEGSIPLVQFKYDKWKHVGRNLIFLATSMLVNLVFGLATVGVFVWSANHEFGLLYLIEWPTWLELLVAVLLLDLVAQYLAHVVLHKVSWMWRLHMVHHSDTKVDATTGTRHHPGDYLVREIFSLAVIFISGMPVAFYLFYRIVTIFFTYVTHANITVPLWLDKPLSLIFITPNMHKFHHHFERPWTDTNFGNVFSFWDRMFGTMVYDDPTKVRYGLDVLDDATDDDVAYQFKLPFDKKVKTDY